MSRSRSGNSSGATGATGAAVAAVAAVAAGGAQVPKAARAIAIAVSRVFSS